MRATEFPSRQFSPELTPDNGQIRSFDRLFQEALVDGERSVRRWGEMRVFADENEIYYAWKPVEDIPQKGQGYKAIKKQPDRWRELIRAEMTHTVTSQSVDPFEYLIQAEDGDSLDFEEASQGTRVFFQIDTDENSASAEYFRETDIIQIRDNLHNPYVFLSLLQQSVFANEQRKEELKRPGLLDLMLVERRERLQAALFQAVGFSSAAALGQLEPFSSSKPDAILHKGVASRYLGLHGPLVEDLSSMPIKLDNDTQGLE